MAERRATNATRHARVFDSEAFAGRRVPVRTARGRQSPVECEQVSRFVTRICFLSVFSPECVMARPASCYLCRPPLKHESVRGPAIGKQRRQPRVFFSSHILVNSCDLVRASTANAAALNLPPPSPLLHPAPGLRPIAVTGRRP